MRAFKLLLLMFVFAAATVSAQNIRKSFTIQDLAGDWELAEQETFLGESRLPDRTENSKEFVRISIKESEVTISRRVEDATGYTERTYVYFVDGRGEANRWTALDGTPMEKSTKSTWKNGVLITKGNYKSKLGSMPIETRCRLSNDLLKLECEEVQQPKGVQPPPLARGLVTRTVYRRL